MKLFPWLVACLVLLTCPLASQRRTQLNGTGTALLPACLTDVDLNTWTAESYSAVSGFPAGAWSVAVSGASVVQTSNGQPTFFHSDFSVMGSSVQGTITVSGGDDDYIGFALGFQPGDATNASADYLLVDWKAATQGFNFGTPSCSPSSTAPVGLAVSRVIGIPTADEFWGHNNTDDICSDLDNGLMELQRGATLGSTGWRAGTVYTFRFDFTATSLQVFVNGTLELDVSGSFSDGRMAFYNFSQAGVTYNAFARGALASWQRFGAGWSGTNGIPDLALSADPVLGTTLDVQVGNSSFKDEVACVVFSMSSSIQPTVYGGTLRVGKPYFMMLGLHPLPLGGTSFPITIPASPSLCGMHAYLEMFQTDPGGSRGFSLTQAIEMTLGDS